jgi:hypothetical protein
MCQKVDQTEAERQSLPYMVIAKKSPKRSLSRNVRQGWSEIALAAVGVLVSGGGGDMFVPSTMDLCRFRVRGDGVAWRLIKLRRMVARQD